MFKSTKQRRWLKRHKPAVAKRIEGRTGKRTRFRRKRGK